MACCSSLIPFHASPLGCFLALQANLVTVDGELHVGEPGSGSCLITENIVIELVGDSNDGATKGIYVTETGLLSVGRCVGSAWGKGGVWVDVL